MLKCCRCEMLKSVSDFTKNNRKKNGLQSYCKLCMKEYEQSPERRQKNKKYNAQYKQNHKEYFRKKQNIYRKKNPEKVKESKQKYYEKNKETIKNYRKTYFKKNAEKVIECSIKWAKKNPGKVKLYNVRKKSRRKEKFGSIVLMNNPFPDEIPINWHHLKNYLYDPDTYLTFILPIPSRIHLYVNGSVGDNEHWKHNGKWIKKLFCMDIGKFLSGEQDFMYYDAGQNKNEIDWGTKNG